MPRIGYKAYWLSMWEGYKVTGYTIPEVQNWCSTREGYKIARCLE